MATIIPQNKSDLSERPLVRSVTGIEIAATGSYAPENIVHNRDLARLGCDEEWIIQRTGIFERRHASKREATSDIALAAAKKCLAASDIDSRDLDLILVATMTPDHYTPSTASLVQSRLGCTAAAIDMNAACSGFLYAFATASQFVKTGCYHNVLVVGETK